MGYFKTRFGDRFFESRSSKLYGGMYKIIHDVDFFTHAAASTALLNFTASPCRGSGELALPLTAPYR
jgi:hypothetical protein